MEFLTEWKKLAQVPEERTLNTFAKFANLSSSSVTVNLDQAFQEGKLKVGDVVVMAAVGEGTTYGAHVLRWAIASPPPPHACHLTPGASTPAVDALRTLDDRLVNVEHYSPVEIFNKVVAAVKRCTPCERHAEFFGDYIPVGVVVEGVPLDYVLDFLEDPANLCRWTLSMRNAQPPPAGGDDVTWLFDEDVSPTKHTWLRQKVDRASRTFSWLCGHAKGDLWMYYNGCVFDAMATHGRPGTAVMWSNYVHERVKKDPIYQMAFEGMHTAHMLEITNMKNILETEFKLGLPAKATGTAAPVRVIRHGEAAVLHPGPGVERRVLARTDHMVLAEVTFPAPITLPLHSHPEEQLGMLVSGEMVSMSDGQETVLKAGDGYMLPSGLPHGGRVVTAPTVMIEAYYPPRSFS
eukprot:TRINITY_DN1119_c0_g1_i4.p1 TRINITY_DN1119_c0_g1~~TRINITY_DN1119_c0_g1_i4.p1  ORF type:complete len:457 (-),score=172.23 TRINITY_DN1119_c0_g1_i4:105-1322(-)